jgi:hypothetical protein
MGALRRVELPVNRQVLRANGEIETLDRAQYVREIKALLNTEKLLGLDTTNGLMMLVDDKQTAKHLPPNERATNFHNANCEPGNQRVIWGDAVVVPKSDFGGN